MRNSPGQPKKLEFPTQNDFWNWFFYQYGAVDSRVMFDDFRLCGCWNWVLDFTEKEYFEEIFYRYQAWKKLGIQGAGTLEETSSKLIDHLLTIDSELEKARWQRQKSETTK